MIKDHEAALMTHDEICKNDDQLAIYTDGSGYQGRVGAAAVCHRAQEQPENQVRQSYLGTEVDSTVYAAELDGIRMALDTAGNISPRSLTLFSDSQAAIQAVQNPRRPSGQYILSAIYRKVRALRVSGLTDIQIHWIPAHVGVAGNEAAKEAAARGEVEVESSSVGRPEQPIIRLAAAAKRAVRQRIQQRWRKQWRWKREPSQHGG
jgi:ribonuclease HI